jgi:hypothetical protein
VTGSRLILKMDSDDELLLAITLIGYSVIKSRKIKRSIWTKKWLQRRYHASMSNTLLRELRYESQYDYQRYLRLDPATFDTLLVLIQEKIERRDTNMRCSISASDRLALTLRYMATGMCIFSCVYLILNCAYK